MDSKTQEQVVGTADQSYWFQMILENVHFSCGLVNTSLAVTYGDTVEGGSRE